MDEQPSETPEGVFQGLGQMLSDWIDHLAPLFPQKDLRLSMKWNHETGTFTLLEGGPFQRKKAGYDFEDDEFDEPEEKPDLKPGSLTNRPSYMG